MVRDTTTYDYVIVGAGSAGGVLANRLSADVDIRVLLLEAGPADDSWTIHMPAAMPINFHRPKYNWRYWTEPQAHLDGRRVYAPRGKTLGGSSAINGMIYIRGHALDYERWVDQGAEGWSYAEVLPYFRRCESHANRNDAYHGADGPLAVVTGERPNPLYEAFIEAGVEAGYPRTDDTNGYQQEGFYRYDMNVDRGRRASHRPRLPAAGPGAAQSDGRGRGAGHPRHLRGRTRRRRRIPPRWPAAGRAGRARGGAVRRCGELAPASDAVGGRPWRRPRGARHPGCPRPSRGRARPP